MYEYPNKSKPTRTTLHEVFSGSSNSSAINNSGDGVAYSSGSIRNRGYICRFFSMIRAVSYLSEVNSCSFVQPVHILHLVVTLGCFRGRKKKQRSICFQAAWTVHCFVPVSQFLFLARQIGAFPFPLRLSYDKVPCGF